MLPIAASTDGTAAISANLTASLTGFAISIREDLCSAVIMQMIYREMLSVALEQLHTAERARARLAAQHEALKDELRRYIVRQVTERELSKSEQNDDEC
jgi:hypothetical protein